MTTPSEAPTPQAVQRLHPASLLFSLGSAARRLLLPGLVVLFASRGGGNTEIWLMLIFVPAAVAAMLRYVSYRYRLGSDEMVVREGIVTRNERHIPYARIQNIDLVQNPLHRLFGVAEVRLQTASGDKPEAVIRVLSLRSVDRLRAHVFHDRSPETEAGAESDTEIANAGRALRALLHLSTRDLVLFGLISNRGMAVVAAAMGLAWQLDLWDWEERMEALPEALQGSVGSLPKPGLLATVVLSVAGLFVLLALLRLFSVVWAILKFHDFTLTRRGEDLRVEYGLLTRVSATIPRGRIQTLTTRSRPFHRALGRTAVLVETAGGGQGEESSGSDRLWLAPLIHEDKLPSLIAEALPEIDSGAIEWQPVERRAWKRLFRRSLVFTGLIGTAAFALVGVWGLSVLLVGGIVSWYHARLSIRHCRYALTSQAVLFRSGWWSRRMSVVRLGKIQALRLGESPFDRRLGMASLRVDTAGGGRIGHGVAIPFLEAKLARGMLDRLYVEAGGRTFEW